MKRATCHHMVSQLHCEAKRKSKLMAIRKSFTAKKEDSLEISKASLNANKTINGTISPSSNGLTDEEKLDILEATTTDKEDNPIDYILIDD